jgi:dihydroneopterin aldolase/2-amino-4-hydroxy-6-hydroxymethyldihydropteridine diphosphokinase
VPPHPPALTDPPDRIELRGLRVLGTHGVLVEEHHRAQPFEVDVDIEAPLAAAGQSDDLSDTIDYGAVTDAVVRVVAGPHVALIEHLAARIVDAVFTTAGPLAEAVGVTVRKLRPPVPADLATAAVSITRRRTVAPTAVAPTAVAPPAVAPNALTPDS